jgi:V8-like Glu-specific endopeptidase
LLGLSALAAAGGGLGCSAEVPGDGPAARREARIVDGVREPDEPAVVLVRNRAGGNCSGSLISERVILTAKHCIQRSGSDAPYPATFFTVVFGRSASDRDATVNVVEVVATPGIFESPFGTVNETLIGTDLGLLVLAEPVTDVVPLPVNTEPAEGFVGEPVTAIGFGQTQRGGSGVKFRDDTVINDVREDGVIATQRVACSGDSGGPLLLAGEIVGVLSFGPGLCRAFGEDGYNRIDLPPLSQLITDTVRDAGGCLDDGAEICDGFDNDCNGEIDEGCQPLGASCETSADCIGGEGCTDLGGTRICTRACDPTVPLLGCPDGLYCGPVGADDDGICQGRCLPGSPGTLAYGAPCEVDTDCGSLNCVDPGDGAQRCLDVCQPDAGLCLAGEICAETAGGCGACVAASTAPAGERGLGEACLADDGCRSGSCLPVDPEVGLASAVTTGREAAAVCSRACDAGNECPPGFHCRSGNCFPGEPGNVGASCFVNDDCGDAGLCARRDIERWCTFVCADDVECGGGFRCTPSEEMGVSVCAPTVGLLGQACAADADCLSDRCDLAGGRCVRSCDAFSPCPTGFGCEREPDGDAGVCLPLDVLNGGDDLGRGGDTCRIAPPGTSPRGPLAASLLPLLGVMLPMLRRRRRGPSPSRARSPDPAGR